MEYAFKDEEAKKWLKSVLHSYNVKITFTKTDGSLREMNCTLSENHIPSENMPKGDGSGRKHNSDSQAVFDLGINEWRSFRWDSIKKIEFEL
jgi:hypothetical protein